MEEEKDWKVIIANAISSIAKDKDSKSGVYGGGGESKAIPIDEKKILIEMLSKLLK